MKQISTTLLLLIAFSFSGISQVVINEYSASYISVNELSQVITEDWVELYNGGDEMVDLSGWHLSDKEHKPGKWDFPQGAQIEPGGFLVVFCSGRDEFYEGHYHTNFKLTQTTGKDFILLTDPEETILESYKLNITLLEHSNCRKLDGADEWVVSTNPSFNRSNNLPNNKYERYTLTPSIQLEPGFYDDVQIVTIENLEDNSVLRYTIDGTNPTNESPIYSEPIEVNKTTVVKARSFSNDPAILPGKMDFSTFFINEDFTVPVFSVAADELFELANGGWDVIPIGSLEYFNLDKEREAVAFGSLNKHGKDSWQLPHRSLDWVSRDEMGYTKAVLAPLFSYSDRDEYQKFMFRNSGDDNYPAKNGIAHEGSTHIRDEFVHTLAMEGGMKLDQRAVEHVVVFLNGEYWGLYGMREKAVDHDYTKEYYDQDKFNIQYLSTWAATIARYGGNQARADWIELRNFILNNDMSIEENYQMVDDNINLTSLIDYMIVNLNVVASDWLNFNTAWWRGMNPEGDHKKWGYILWDLDATFDYYINYTGIPNTDSDAVPCSLEDISDFLANSTEGRHEKIFLKLLEENEEFKQLYYSRYADMMNTVFTCENMISTLDRLLDVTRPEMPRQIERWGGSMLEWESNVVRLKDYINERCVFLDDGMIECYDELNGPYQVTLLTEPNGVGEIDLNTLDIESFPWSGDYFGGMDNKIKAKVFDEFQEEYEFSHWKSSSGSVITPDLATRKATIVISQPDTLTAVFKKIEVNTHELGDEYQFSLYPNPANTYLILDFNLNVSTKVNFALHTILGEKILNFNGNSGYKTTGSHQEKLSIPHAGLSSGLYILMVEIGGKQRSFKVNIVK